jgi:hypothetical protein
MMPSPSFRRYLVRFRRVWRDILFRGIVFATISLFAFGFVRNYPDQGQKQERQQSSEDRRVEADERVANYTLWLDMATVILAFSTLGLWIVTWRGLASQSRDVKRAFVISRNSSLASIESNRLSRELFISEHRPWISVDVIPSSEFKTNKNGESFFFVQVTFKNHGNIPAVRMIWNFHGASDRDRFEDDQDKISERNRKFIAGGHIGVGASLFPKEELTDSKVIVIPAHRQTGTRSGFASDPDRLSEEYIEHVVMGCVDYASPHGGLGRTKFAFMLGKNTEGKGIIVGVGYMIERTDKRLPPEALVLKRMPTRGNIAE